MTDQLHGPIGWARRQQAEREARQAALREQRDRQAEQTVELIQRHADLRIVLDEVLRKFVHKGHPGEPCLSSGWISEKTVARWRAVLYPPQPAHDAGPTVREAAAQDRAYWERKDAGEDT